MLLLEIMHNVCKWTIKNNALITNRGSGLGTSRSYTNVPIVGDGSGAEATIVVGNDSTVESINITSGGQVDILMV
jgi:hypothetical protein